ncbi:hypothetical protein KIN20_019188 [Parelaphostrongylus tenuis]|uniref:HIG1 domain-containing protein n=1 Tax=Parelaphostrongylus tenuis TaxID=148309 RepID=A0AAD5N1Y6_PARTN|nr:hypothetical protein KIN20_019188 [Parelaphostrongylus tenuis]
MDIFRKVFMSDTNVQEPPRDSVMRVRHPTPEQEAQIMENTAKHTGEPRQGSVDWEKHLDKAKMRGTRENEGKYSGIPAIPSDIGFSSGKDTGGRKKSGVVSQVMNNPGVILGMGLTTLALLGMFKSSFIGDKLGTQKYMRYRILAQFFTVTALVAGVTIFGATYEDKSATKANETVQKS